MARAIRKEIKQPDKLQVYAEKVMEFLLAYTKQIAVATGVVVLVLAVFFGYRYWTQRMNRQASMAYTLALMAAPDGKGPKVESALRGVIEKYPSTRAGLLARLQLASLLESDGKFAEAESTYRAVLGSASLPSDKELAQRGIAGALAAQGKCAQAIPIWREIISRGSVFTSEDLYISVGACYEKMGKPGEALKAYQELSQKFPTSPFLDESLRARMQRLAEAAKKPAKK